MNYTSVLPLKAKSAIIRNEVNRICAKSSSLNDRDSIIDRFKAVLKLNDYPTAFINRETFLDRQRRQQNPVTQGTSITSDFPFYLIP